jgi:putative transcriptional regulator
MTMLHYTDCGLDNVYLENGFHRHKNAHGEEGISIEDIDGLHQAIGRDLVESPSELTGAEFRFLRLELDLSQRRLADLINADEQAVRRWEKARTKPVKGSAERMTRVLYKACLNGNGDIKGLIERLAELDAQPSRRLVLRETKCGWTSEHRMAA